MKLFCLCIFIAVATAAVTEIKAATKYLPPQEKTANEVIVATPETAVVLSDDGYQYKTVRRLSNRQKRDISEVAQEYLPPAESTIEKDYLPPSEETATEVIDIPEYSQDTAVLADDGYQYKTIRRLRYRKRREVANHYVPAAQEVADLANEYLPPVVEAVENEYLPPTEENVTEAAEIADASLNTSILGDNGYQYKTVRRLKYRQRRDISEISNEYLPPAEEVLTEATTEIKEPHDTAVLGVDGYQYKTVRRLKYRQRREASEIVKPNRDYLPPSAAAVIDIPVLPKDPSEVEQNTAVLQEDGYHYKQPAEAFSLAPAIDLPIVGDNTIVIEGPKESAARYRTVRLLTK